VDDGDTVRPPVSLGLQLDPDKLILTFDGLLQRSDLVPLLKTALARLAEQYQLHVDVEFAVSVEPGEGGKPALTFHLLQCRPQNQWKGDTRSASIPANLAEADKIFLSTRMVPQGFVEGVEYLVHVDTERYHQLPTPREYTEVARLIGQINKALEGKAFILVGPGRWGSSDAMQGVPVTYADIYNSRALIEVASQKRGFSSEPSYGTHFFQDLVESQIFPLAVYPEEGSDHLAFDFIQKAADQSGKFIPEPTEASRCIRVIHIPAERPGCLLNIAMDGQQGMGYLVSSAPATKKQDKGETKNFAKD
jgi:hypothetical protein